MARRQFAAEPEITLNELARYAKDISRRLEDSKYDDDEAIDRKKQRCRHKENDTVATAHPVSTIEQSKMKTAPDLVIGNQTPTAGRGHSIRNPHRPGYGNKYQPPPKNNSHNGYNRQGANANYQQHQHQPTDQHAHPLQNRQQQPG